MKYALLILGALLVLIGGFAAYWGFGIIEVERGWASVISGATAVTGGIIVIALAWILGSIDRLRVALESATAQRAILAAAPAERAVVPLAAFSAAAVERDEPIFDATDSADIADTYAPAAGPPAAPPQQEAAEPPHSRAATAFASAAAKARDERRTEPSIGELWRRVGLNLDANHPDRPANVKRDAAPSSPPPAAPANDAAAESRDWLDQTLAKFDANMPADSAPPSEEPPPLAPEAAPDEPGSQAVIGRYEADGTAYVMYADGSIEAQSEQGVLRFQSMAELKAFFHC